MAKYCFICGNDWCLNLTDDPIKPEDNICDNCRDLNFENKCSSCRKEQLSTRNINRQRFLYLLIFIIIAVILGLISFSFFGLKGKILRF